MRKLSSERRTITLSALVEGNSVNVHKTIGKTPAMAAGITDRVWKVADLVAMLEDEERRAADGGRINRADRTYEPLPNPHHAPHFPALLTPRIRSNPTCLQRNVSPAAPVSAEQRNLMKPQHSPGLTASTLHLSQPL